MLFLRLRRIRRMKLSLGLLAWLLLGPGSSSAPSAAALARSFLLGCSVRVPPARAPCEGREAAVDATECRCRRGAMGRISGLEGGCELLRCLHGDPGGRFVLPAPRGLRGRPDVFVDFEVGFSGRYQAQIKSMRCYADRHADWRLQVVQHVNCPLGAGTAMTCTSSRLPSMTSASTSRTSSSEPRARKHRSPLHDRTQCRENSPPAGTAGTAGSPRKALHCVEVAGNPAGALHCSSLRWRCRGCSTDEGPGRDLRLGHCPCRS